jgi:hypothetical protein
VTTIGGNRSYWLNVIKPNSGDSNSGYPGTASTVQLAWAESAAITDFALETIRDAGFNEVLLAVRLRDGAVWPSAVWPVSTQNPGPGSGTAEDDPLSYALDKADELGLSVLLWVGQAGDHLHDGTGGLPDWLSTSHDPGEFLDLTISDCRDKIVATNVELCTLYGAHPACAGLLLDYIRAGGGTLVGGDSTTAIANVRDIIDRTKVATDAAGLLLTTWGHHSEAFWSQGNQSVDWLNEGTIHRFYCGFYGIPGNEAHTYEDVMFAMGYTAPSGNLDAVDADKRDRIIFCNSGSKDNTPGDLQLFMSASEFQRVFWEAQAFNPGQGLSIFNFGRTDDGVLDVMSDMQTTAPAGPRTVTFETIPSNVNVPDASFMYYRPSTGQRIDWDGTPYLEVEDPTDPMMSGYRIVANRINRVQMATSEDLSLWTATTTTLGVSAGVYTATPTGGADSLIQRSNIVISQHEDPVPGAGQYRFRVRVRPSTNNQQIRLRLGNAGDGFVNQDITLPTSGTWYNVASAVATRSAGQPLTAFIYPDRSGSNNALDIIEPGVGGFGIYNVTREPSNMIPEYVYREANHADFMVDQGISYKSTLNGNSIASGIITDSAGAALTTSASHVGFGYAISNGVIAGFADHGMSNGFGQFVYDIHPAFAHDDDKGGVVTLVAGGSATDDYFKVEMAQSTGIVTARVKMSGSTELTATLDEIEFSLGDRLRIGVYMAGGLFVRITNIDTDESVSGRVELGTSMRWRNAFPVMVGGNPQCANQAHFLLRRVYQQASVPKSTGAVDLF